MKYEAEISDGTLFGTDGKALFGLNHWQFTTAPYPYSDDSDTDITIRWVLKLSFPIGHGASTDMSVQFVLDILNAVPMRHARLPVARVILVPYQNLQNASNPYTQVFFTILARDRTTTNPLLVCWQINSYCNCLIARPPYGRV